VRLGHASVRPAYFATVARAFLRSGSILVVRTDTALSIAAGIFAGLVYQVSRLASRYWRFATSHAVADLSLPRHPLKLPTDRTVPTARHRGFPATGLLV